jgi:hypothetical protein
MVGTEWPRFQGEPQVRVPEDIAEYCSDDASVDLGMRCDESAVPPSRGK